jgi:hypothetical protein
VVVVRATVGEVALFFVFLEWLGELSLTHSGNNVFSYFVKSFAFQLQVPYPAILVATSGLGVSQFALSVQNVLFEFGIPLFKSFDLCF